MLITYKTYYLWIFLLALISPETFFFFAFINFPKHIYSIQLLVLSGIRRLIVI